MKYEVNQHVRHRTFGLGKIITVDGVRVEVIFKEQKRKPIAIITNVVPLEVLADQSDPELDNLVDAVTRSHKSKNKIRNTIKPEKKARFSHKVAIAKFLYYFPKGFEDPRYTVNKKAERRYKWHAHELWIETLNQPEFSRLLAAEQYEEIAARAMKVESRTYALMFPMEKAALHEGVEGAVPAKQFAIGLYDLIYGSDPFEFRFNRFSEVLEKLPQRQMMTLKWPIQTIFPFVALPNEHIFLKPDVTQEAARRCTYPLNYKACPNWDTYLHLLQFAKFLMQDLIDLKPIDMIDIQSFIWVTGRYPDPEGLCLLTGNMLIDSR